MAHGKARRARAGAEVGILPVDEEALVEPAEPGEQGTPDHQEGAHHRVHRPRLGMVPVEQEMRGHAAGQQPVEEQGVGDQARSRRMAGAGAVRAPRLVDQPGADDADAFIRSEHGAGRPDAVPADPRVGIEEQDRLRLAQGRPLIAGPGEAAIVGVAQHGEREIRPFEPLGRAVGGGVVDHDDAQVRGIPARGEAREAVPELVSGIPVDDDDVEERPHGGASAGRPSRPPRPRASAPSRRASTRGENRWRAQ